MSSKLIRGTFILTLGTILSKILGLFYVIPFKAIIGGESAYALYSYGYNPYTIFISIATAGVPMAVSKYIAKYNALGEYEVGHRLFRSGLIVMTLTGVVSFFVMYGLATPIAEMVLKGAETDFTTEDVASVVRAVSFALLVIPAMSLIRGFFQGNQSMGPSAVSTVIEQLARIIFLLAGSFMVIYILKGSVVTAIGTATFAAFIGGIASLIVLLWYWKKRKPKLDEQRLQSKGDLTVSLGSMYKEILIYAFPFVMVGIANPLYTLIDQFTFNRAMAAGNQVVNYLDAYGTLTLNHKLVIIPVSLATAFAMTLVPLITESFVNSDRKILFRQLDQTLQVLLFITLPASLGLMILAEPFYTVFYGYSDLGTEVLKTYAPVAILFALYSVTAAILQGINEQRFTILSLLTGILIKLSLNIPLIEAFGTEGAIYATTLGYFVSIAINLVVIKIFSKYPLRLVYRRVLLIIIFNVAMLVPVYFVYLGLHSIMNPESRLQGLLLIFICAAVGAMIYGYLGLKSGLADRLFGERLTRFKKKLGMN
ncbi:transporter [Bacillus sp. J14TS2]|uniref:putative polysaccharide biosynthesis protein n=1 Tax=unclassified Bacillus (in: firmicutes) TaxID=185979 RepID=UPI001A9769DE|nr:MULTISPECIES: polysaccharide biosynthesis protein [unclassified Bacillus (in: firmicutes)]MBO0992439.1 polysaccharide biosynthesis protein [Bacillus sp. SD088]GIN73082.1 transporter [Bacillus sp. J14TS2]